MSKLLSTTAARGRICALAGVLPIALAAAQAWGAETPPPPDGLTFLGQVVTDRQISQGRALYAQHCASCHGANLEGQRNWKRRLDSGRMPAPPHDESGHTWHHSDQALFRMTKSGVGAVIPGYESDMPAFDGILSDRHIIFVLSYIKSQWPEQIRVRQAEITKQHQESTER